MTENEKELITLIRESDNPELALITAIDIIISYLKRHESFVKPFFVDSRELA